MKKIAESTLYAKDQNDSIREWKIDAVIKNNGEGELRIKHGKIDGEKIHNFEEIPCGLASRSIEEQTMSRFNSRLNKKIDSGYVYSLEDAIKNERVNSLGFKKPMLAAKYVDVAKQIPFKDGVHVQRKYNGYRCMIINDNGTLIPYSRNGKIISSIDHILNEIEIPNNTILDGELYCHGVSFQTVSSWIKKKQPETKQISYIVYDLVDSGNFTVRVNKLREFEFLFSGKFVQLAPVYTVFSEDEAKKELEFYIHSKYEGAIIRISNKPYEPGKRSKSLIKMKKFLDDEFLVTGITASMEGLAILHCRAKNGKIFKVSAPGNREEKREILINFENYVGKMVNVEYAELTEYGIPFHPVAKFFRDKGAE